MQHDTPAAAVPVDVLRSVPLLNSLSEIALAGLAGKPLFAEESAEAGLCIVRDGLLQAVELAPSQELLVRSIRPNEVVDPGQALAGAQHQVAIRAAEDSRVWIADASDVERMADRCPDLRQARERLHRRQLLCRLYPILGPLNKDFLNDLEIAAD